jgi:hypothetical protein
VLLSGEGSGRVPWGPEEDVPHWATDPDARRSDDDLGARYAGAALIRAWVAARDGLLLFVLSLLAVAGLSRCNADALASCPPWVALLLVAGVARLLWHEHQVRKVLLVPVARRLTATGDLPPALLGIKLSFTCWLLCITLVSAASHADLTTNVLFTARVLRTRFCGEWDMWKLWAHMCHQSLIPGLGYVPLSAWALLGWTFMALQAVHTVCGAWPLTGLDTQGNKIQYHVGAQHNYQVKSHETVNHTSALYVLLTSCRMASLVTMFRTNSLHEFSKDARTRMFIPSILGVGLTQMIGRFVIFNVLENSFQPNFQAAVLGLDKALEDDHSLDLFTLASVIISLVLGTYNICKEVAYATQIKNMIVDTDIDKEIDEYMPGLSEALDLGDWSDEAVWAQVKQAFQGEVEADAIRPVGINIGTRRIDGRAKQKAVHRNYYCFLALVGVWVLLAGRAAKQTFQVVMCPTGLSNTGVGCLDLPAGYTARKAQD